MSARPFRKSERGQMLVQVLVASAIGGVVMASLASMLNAQNRSASAITQKLGANDLQQLMMTAINSGGACETIVSRLGGAATFAASQVGSPTPPTIPLNSIPISSAPGAPPLVSVGDQPSPMSKALVVSGINLVIKGGSGTQFRGEIQVEFDHSKLINPLRPVTVSVLLQTSGGGNPVISSCRMDSGLSADAPGAPCVLPGDRSPRGFVTYSWSTNIGPGKYCCMADPTTQNISYGAYRNGGFATLILACKALAN